MRKYIEELRFQKVFLANLEDLNPKNFQEKHASRYPYYTSASGLAFQLLLCDDHPWLGQVR